MAISSMRVAYNRGSDAADRIMDFFAQRKPKEERVPVIRIAFGLVATITGVVVLGAPYIAKHSPTAAIITSATKSVVASAANALPANSATIPSEPVLPGVYRPGAAPFVGTDTMRGVLVAVVDPLKNPAHPSQARKAGANVSHQLARRDKHNQVTP
jgi:hypothetical protein